MCASPKTGTEPTKQLTCGEFGAFPKMRPIIHIVVHAYLTFYLWLHVDQIDCHQIAESRADVMLSTASLSIVATPAVLAMSVSLLCWQQLLPYKAKLGREIQYWTIVQQKLTWCSRSTAHSLAPRETPYLITKPH